MSGQRMVVNRRRFLQSTPLGEMLYIALFLATLLALVKLCDQVSIGSALTCGACVLLASLTRYDGWVLAPFGAALVLTATICDNRLSAPTRSASITSAPV